MWTRRRWIPLLAGLVLAAPSVSAQVDLSSWTEREDRILVVVLLDGFDESRLDRSVHGRIELLPGMRGVAAEAIVFEDVQSAAISPRLGASMLFDGAAPPIVEGSPSQLGAALQDALAATGPQTLVLSSGLFADPRELDEGLLRQLDPLPWRRHGVADSRETQWGRRRQRLTMLLRLYRDGRPIRRGGNDAELEWVADGMHARADASFRPFWERLRRPELRDRCLIVVTARVGAADPRRGAPAPADALRPDLVDVPFWVLTPERQSLRLPGPHTNAELLGSLRAVDARQPLWIPPEAHAERYSLQLLGDQAAIFWREAEWSLLLRSDGAHAIYDRSNDPDEWDDLAPQQASAVQTLRTRLARRLMGAALSVRIESDGSQALTLQPADAVSGLTGSGHAEGPLLRLEGPGPWEFQMDPAAELRLHSSRAETRWRFGEDEPRTGRQMVLAMPRPEWLGGFFARAPEDTVSIDARVRLRAGEGGLLHRP